MLDGLRPLTVLAGAFAAWSLGLLLLALAGLGGRVGPHPADPALIPPLPEPVAAEERPRLGALSDYLAVGERPLFHPERRPLPVTAVATEIETPFEGVLTSVLLTETLRMAIFSDPGGTPPRRVRLGEALPGTGWRLAALEPRRAVLEGPGGQRVLELRVFDGKGGAAPTAITPTTVFPAADASATPPVIDPAAEAEAVRRAIEQQAEVEAIRAQIEARRARLREGHSPAAVPVEQ